MIVIVCFHANKGQILRIIEIKPEHTFWHRTDKDIFMIENLRQPKLKKKSNHKRIHPSHSTNLSPLK